MAFFVSDRFDGRNAGIAYGEVPPILTEMGLKILVMTAHTPHGIQVPIEPVVRIEMAMVNPIGMMRGLL